MERKNRTKRRAFGVVLGIVVALLLDSILLEMNLHLLLLRSPLGILGLPILLVLAVGVLIGLVMVGIAVGFWAAEKQWVPPVAWWVTVLVAVIGSLSVWGPVAIRILHLYLIVPGEIPVYPAAEGVQTVVRPLALLGPANVEVTFRTKASYQEIVQFYQDELIRRGWKDGPTFSKMHFSCGTPHWFQKTSYWFQTHRGFMWVKYHRSLPSYARADARVYITYQASRSGC
jgi:hypothetical protein